MAQRPGMPSCYYAHGCQVPCCYLRKTHRRFRQRPSQHATVVSSLCTDRGQLLGCVALTPLSALRTARLAFKGREASCSLTAAVSRLPCVSLGKPLWYRIIVSHLKRQTKALQCFSPPRRAVSCSSWGGEVAHLQSWSEWMGFCLRALLFSFYISTTSLVKMGFC